MDKQGFHGLATTVAGEIADVLQRVDEKQIADVVATLTAAPRAFVLGVGREGLAARGFAMRLGHTGLETHWGWDDTTPAVENEDVFVLVNGSGEIGHLDYVFAQVKATGAKTIVVTGVPEAHTPQNADLILAVPASVYKGRGDLVPSIQPMGSLFEQSTLITLDLVVLMLAREKNLTFSDLAARHRNFE